MEDSILKKTKVVVLKKLGWTFRNIKFPNDALYPGLSSSGSYSLAKSTVLKGTESRFRYQNPHVDFVIL